MAYRRVRKLDYGTAATFLGPGILQYLHKAEEVRASQEFPRSLVLMFLTVVMRLLLMTVQELHTRPEEPARVLAATASLYSLSVPVSSGRLCTAT